MGSCGSIVETQLPLRGSLSVRATFFTATSSPFPAGAKGRTLTVEEKMHMTSTKDLCVPRTAQIRASG